MTHFGIICPAESGHINTMFPLAQELQKRGHRLTLITMVDAQAKALAAGLEFKPIGVDLFPLGKLTEDLAVMGKLSGTEALKYAVQFFKNNAIAILIDVPKIIEEENIEALLIDQSCSGGSTVAELLGVPFITICSAVVLNREVGVPPFNTLWPYSPTIWARLRNQIGYKILDRLAQPIRDVTIEYRQRWNLPQHTDINQAYSPLAQISQQPAEFEFPRETLPQWFHFTGPYHYSAPREPVPFPWEKLTQQPLIYASMGTVQNRLIEVFETIASACVGLDAQLVITLGGSTESLPELPGNPLVVSYAPQLELLRKAALTITHAGMNTTLECLTNGVPMVAIPIANDQPGIAARIAWTGVGEVIPFKKLTSEKLKKAIRKVLTEDHYKANVLRLQQAIQKAGGVSQAADIIEKAVTTGEPVLA
ncbi:glycosyltransferase [Gloeocapsa sp. PCC 73106]|uniref:glycosyltransferase n=1 Tax=Gloeocapsa sp. PCC 73106 TaxID=102232 RepID=UPI0002AC7DFF|nr:glycosyltransferase [Gloeocapsa sp. PCC 73106]ELR98249.1 glycosyltransferase, MGT family [Gloeocapsa sp. PCC 73106]